MFLRLYPILRLDYIWAYVISSVPVRIIFDDILVLNFTCHPETVQDLKEAVLGAVVIEVGR